jgi:hypothetical protein
MIDQFNKLFEGTALGKHLTGDGLKHRDSSESVLKRVSIAAYLDNNSTEEN